MVLLSRIRPLLVTVMLLWLVPGQPLGQPGAARGRAAGTDPTLVLETAHGSIHYGGPTPWRIDQLELPYHLLRIDLAGTRVRAWLPESREDGLPLFPFFVEVQGQAVVELSPSDVRFLRSYQRRQLHDRVQRREAVTLPETLSARVHLDDAAVRAASELVHDLAERLLEPDKGGCWETTAQGVLSALGTAAGCSAIGTPVAGAACMLGMVLTTWTATNAWECWYWEWFGEVRYLPECPMSNPCPGFVCCRVCTNPCPCVPTGACGCCDPQCIFSPDSCGLP